MKSFNGKQLITLIYLAIIAVSIFRIAVHPSHYTTPDSIAYLKQADFIKTSWKSSESLVDFYRIKGSFTTWPLGYPVSIAAVSSVTGASSLNASKIVNFVFLGLLFILLFKLFVEKAWFVSLAFLSYGSLEVIAETWSELPFVFFILLLCYLVLNEKHFSPWKLSLLLIVCLTLLFLFRYVGVIYFFVLAGFLIKHGLSKNFKLAASYFVALLISSTFVLWYFYENKTVSGFYSGMPRLETGHKGFWGFSVELFQGLFNEFAIARNYFFKGMPDLLFIALTLAQAGVLFILFKGRKPLSHPIRINDKIKTLSLFGLGYLIGIILFKIFIPIDAFDFRVLFPFSALMFVAIFAFAIDDSQEVFFKKHSRLVIGFMLLSLIINLPKNYILESIRQLFG